MAFGKASNIQGDDGMIRKLHEIEMRLNGIEHVYLKDLEKKIAKIAIDVGAFSAEEKASIIQRIKDVEFLQSAIKSATAATMVDMAMKIQEKKAVEPRAAAKKK
jgi:hypothetical protein